jgi:hypothetical protein
MPLAISLPRSPEAARRSYAPPLLLCPICKSRARACSSRGRRGFYCKIHGHFKVADTIGVDDYYTSAEWEVALRAAKYKAMEGGDGLL